MLRGHAVGSEGRAQACVGIAWGSPDFDANLDLVVTNFGGETVEAIEIVWPSRPRQTIEAADLRSVLNIVEQRESFPG